MRNGGTPAMDAKGSPDDEAREYLKHASAQRVNTNLFFTTALRRQYPKLSVVPAPTDITSLLGYAQAGFAQFTPLTGESDPTLDAPFVNRIWARPARRRDDSLGSLADQLIYGKFSYKWKDHEFLLYVADGRDGTSSYPQETYNYLIGSDEPAIDALIAECSNWTVQLHNEIWVFDQGFWVKNHELWKGIQKAEWQDVILDHDMKLAIRHDTEDFFDAEESYQKLHVPWKRGLIFHGPPGNGKTISIKATMHELLRKQSPIPTLYVRTLNSAAGPEYSVRSIFQLARQQAPCFLVFEDLDSIVSDRVRSYFLNEVDGMAANDGILMVGSTNHLDLLDPGLSKRPSRFDRKYFFPDPNLAQRTAYAKYWQKKLATSKEIEFPDKLCPAVASITDGFSFAYIQEAFVASLLALAQRSSHDNDAAEASPAHPETEIDYGGLTQTEAAQEYNKIVANLREKKKLFEQLLNQLETNKGSTSLSAVTAAALPATLDSNDGPSLDDLPLWRELKKQIAILREGMDDSGRIQAQAASAKIGPVVTLPMRGTIADDPQPRATGMMAARNYEQMQYGGMQTPRGMIDEMQEQAARTGGGRVYIDH